MKLKPERKPRLKIVRPLTPATLDEFVEALGNTKWMREATESLKKFLLSGVEQRGDVGEGDMGSHALVQGQLQGEVPRGGNNVTAGSSKGKGGKSQPKFAAHWSRRWRDWKLVHGLSRHGMGDSSLLRLRTPRTTVQRKETEPMMWQKVPGHPWGVWRGPMGLGM